MDGLMFDTEKVSIIVWKKAAEKLNFSISEKFIATFCGRNNEAIKALFLEKYGPDFDYERTRTLRMEFLEDYVETRGVPLKEGLKELLAYLESEGIPAAVATSTDRRLAEKILRIAGVYESFKAHVFGDEVTRSKPFPDIFLKAAEKLGKDPRECLVLEDSEAGVRAGKAAGGYVIHVPDMVCISEEAREGITDQKDSLLGVIEWLECNKY